MHVELSRATKGIEMFSEKTLDSCENYVPKQIGRF